MNLSNYTPSLEAMKTRLFIQSSIDTDFVLKPHTEPSGLVSYTLSFTVPRQDPARTITFKADTPGEAIDRTMKALVNSGHFKPISKVDFIEISTILLGSLNPTLHGLTKLADDFHEANPELNTYNFSGEIEREFDHLGLTASYCLDKIDDFGTLKGQKYYNRSRTNKVRKALGYTY